MLQKRSNIRGLLEVTLSVDLQQTTSTDFGLELSNVKNELIRVGFNKTTNSYYIDRTNAGKKDFSENFAVIHTASRIVSDNTLSLHIFIDRASVELFADGGSTCMTDIFFPTHDFSTVRLYHRDGEVRLVDGTLFELKSIW